MDQPDEMIKRNRGRRWRPWPSWPWRRQTTPPPPAWPTEQTVRPTWATEQQQILPTVKAGYPVYPECGDLR